MILRHPWNSIEDYSHSDAPWTGVDPWMMKLSDGWMIDTITTNNAFYLPRNWMFIHWRFE